jgi:hypothetical protein
MRVLFHQPKELSWADCPLRLRIQPVGACARCVRSLSNGSMRIQHTRLVAKTSANPEMISPSGGLAEDADEASESGIPGSA